MVVSKDEVFEVVLVVEDTANLVPYFEILMKSYILPTLEYFNNGPPDPIDYGIDYCCTLYNVVTFHAGDVALAPAASCTLPTNSTNDVITHLEKLELVGGAGQASSHIAEGLSTALQVFDDFKRIRHPGVSSTRHCVLVCNSPPYHMAAEESSDYSGYNTEQLASMMGKRGIQLSIISPKKIAALQKMFDAAGAGDVSYPGHPQKDYTTDPRHMVLLHGYQLQERSHSPANDDDKQMDPTKMPHNVKSPVTAGGVGEGGPFKVPSSIVPSQPSIPMTMNNQPNAPSNSQNPANMAGSNVQMTPGMHQMNPGMPPHHNMPPHQQPPGFQPGMVNMMPNQVPQAGGGMSGQQRAAVLASMQANNDMKSHIMSVRGGGMGHQRMLGPGSMAMSTQGVMMVPPGQSVMASQGSVQPGHMPLMPQNQPGMGNPMGVSSAASMTSQAMGMNNPNMMATSMAMSQTPSSFPGASQGGMGPRAGGPQSGMSFAMQQGGMGAGGISTPSSTAGMAVPSSGGADMPADPNAAVRHAVPALRDRKIVWTGALEYHEKSKATPGQVGQQQKITWLLTCRISITSTEPELQTVNWPEKLSLQLLPQNMLSELQSLCRNSRQVAFHFSNTDQEALRNLHKLMGTGFAGCVHFPPQSASETRIILLLFSGKKKAFIGLIPNDQSAFVQGIKNVLTQHKLKNQPKSMHTSMTQAAMATISQQNMPQGQGGNVMDTSVLTGGQNAMVTATTGPAGTVSNQPMMSSQNPNQNPQAVQLMEANKQMQYGQKQNNPNQKMAAMMRQQQLLAQQQMNRQPQRMQMQQQQQAANQQQLRQMLQQQEMRQQLMMQQQQQQQHGRQPGPQNHPGVMPPGSQVTMQGMQMGQMGGQPTQNMSSMDDLNFDF